MAIIACTECGKEFSDRALACPNCACPTDVVLKVIAEVGAPNNALKTVAANAIEPTTVNVLLKEVGPSKISVLQIVREVTGLGLAEAKGIVDKAPTYIFKDVQPGQAEVIKKKFMEVGSVIEIIDASINTNFEFSKTTNDKTFPNVNTEKQTQISPIINYQDPSIRCPKCGSNNYMVISGASKAVQWALWGPFAAGKLLSKYHCQSCKHNF